MRGDSCGNVKEINPWPVLQVFLMPNSEIFKCVSVCVDSSQENNFVFCSLTLLFTADFQL